jgi:SAM-dependent methyltransferase
MPAITEFEPSQLETLTACPFCNCASVDYLFSERGFTYVECRSCRLIFLSTRLREEQLGLLYDSDGYHSAQPSAANRRTAQKRVQLLGSLPAGARVVEDAAGDGLFVRACLEHGYSATGCDLGKDAVAKALLASNVQLANCTLEGLSLEAGSVDAVASFNLLSHLYRPWDYVQLVARALRPGGVWLTRVGDKTGWKKLLARGAWSAPEHVFHFPLALIERMAQAAGLELELARPAFDSDFPETIARLGKRGGLPGRLGRGASQLALGAWIVLRLPRDDYYLRFVKR